MKVGSENHQDDVDRARAIRSAIGEDKHLMMDANQKWYDPLPLQKNHLRHPHHLPRACRGLSAVPLPAPPSKLRLERVFGSTLRLNLCACRDVPETIEKMKALSEFRPLWIEEPTNCDDVIGHRVIQKHLNQLANPVGVATGEVAQNKIIFKQLLQVGRARSRWVGAR